MSVDDAACVDWENWHADYDHPGSELELRLRIVQSHVAAWLDRLPRRRRETAEAPYWMGNSRVVVEVGVPSFGSRTL